MNSLSSPKLGGKYLTIRLAEETYGIAVLQVREIIRLPKITPVPHLPDHVRGVINLRSRVMPVIDLRLRFGLEAAITGRTCIVVVQGVLGADRSALMGLIVDTVEEVATLRDADIEPLPEFARPTNRAPLLGVATTEGRVTTLLDIDRVVAPAATHPRLPGG